MILRNNKFRLAILVSHPIHYQVWLYRRLSQHPQIDLTVYFCSDFGINPKPDPELGKSFDYGTSILEGYAYRFLKNISPYPSLNHFLGLVNVGILKELYREKYDAIWVHGWSNLTHWFCFLSSWLTKTPLMLRGESTFLHSGPLRFNFVKKLLLTFLFKRVEVFLPIGRLNANFYQAYGADEKVLFPVPYGVDNEYFLNQDKIYHLQKELIKKQMGIPSEKVIVLFVGKLVERKRPFDLLKAFEMLGEEKAILLFIGEGKQRSILQDYVQKKNIKEVYFMGFISQVELPKFFSIADIFVLPSRHEPWGMVVNEAMNFSFPIITTDKVGAAYDLIKAGENGFIYPVGDIDRLAQYLLRLIHEPQIREKMGKCSLEIINKWGYKEDIEGILSAIEYVRKKCARRLNSLRNK